jgi:type II secretory pathway pseudopilin PulG
MVANQLVAVVALTAVMAVAAARPLLNFRRGNSSARREELEAAKRDAYKRIRAAQLDWRLGKLTDGDFEALHADLSAEAITILKQIDELK